MKSVFRARTLSTLVLQCGVVAGLIAQQRDTLPRDTTTLAPVVVTASRLPSVRELLRGLTGRTATLQGADLDARGVRTLADALEVLPGVTTSDELGAPSQLDVTLRGFEVSPTIGVPQGITVYVDGVRANEPDANEVNFDILPLEDVERVEVVYGPSVLLGRNSLGAADDLDALHVFEREDIEIDLVGIRFVRPDAVNVHRDALGDADRRRDLKTAQRDVELRRRAQLIGGGDAGQHLEGVGERADTTGVEIGTLERRGPPGEAPQQLADRRQARRGDDDGCQRGGVPGKRIALLRDETGDHATLQHERRQGASAEHTFHTHQRVHRFIS